MILLAALILCNQGKGGYVGKLPTAGPPAKGVRGIYLVATVPTQSIKPLKSLFGHHAVPTETFPMGTGRTLIAVPKLKYQRPARDLVLLYEKTHHRKDDFATFFPPAKAFISNKDIRSLGN